MKDEDLGKGSRRDGYPDEELFAVLEDRRQGWDDFDATMRTPLTP